ncbi:hypothetical protein G5V59_13605 [Nocardioides sp. W3-2-3]|uniref:hypothetical protein n=1 Tax=Nocardioides convexus TaxID=2712224 RepID=UPI0024185200|nr:hypothetical protein [Nocardioides convexus]NHA00694.1 hypothetical protein [Nocardioides convexus]
MHLLADQSRAEHQGADGEVDGAVLRGGDHEVLDPVHRDAGGEQALARRTVPEGRGEHGQAVVRPVRPGDHPAQPGRDGQPARRGPRGRRRARRW